MIGLAEVEPYLQPHERKRILTLAESVPRLAQFVQRAWPVVEPTTPYTHGRHIEVVSEHLEALVDGEIDKLLINIPVRAMKSLLVAAFFPAWLWGPKGDPGARFIFASYRERLAMRDSLRTRRIVESTWYTTLWPWVRIVSDQNEKMRFDNSFAGYRIASSVTGGNTGEGADYVVADDPHNAANIWSETERENVKEWWDDVMSSRTGRWPTNRKVVVMQRLHEDDLSGHILAEKGDYVHLFLPQEYDPQLSPGRAGQPAKSKPSPLGPVDWRTTPGELLWPERFNAEVIKKIKTTEMTPVAYAAQHQQVPAPAEGVIFLRRWWRFHAPAALLDKLPPVKAKLPEGGYVDLPCIPTPARVAIEIQSWDMAFKDAMENDYVCGQHWGKQGGDFFLYDLLYRHLDFPASLAAVRAWCYGPAAKPRTSAKLVEDKANGSAVIQTLRHQIPGLIAIEPEGGKVARAHAVAPFVHSGNVYLPHPATVATVGGANWVEALIGSCAAFPNAAHDDDVDALTQALTYLARIEAVEATYTTVRASA